MVFGFWHDKNGPACISIRLESFVLVLNMSKQPIQNWENKTKTVAAFCSIFHYFVCLLLCYIIYQKKADKTESVSLARNQNNQVEVVPQFATHVKPAEQPNIQLIRVKDSIALWLESSLRHQNWNCRHVLILSANRSTV